MEIQRLHIEDLKAEIARQATRLDNLSLRTPVAWKLMENGFRKLDQALLNASVDGVSPGLTTPKNGKRSLEGSLLGTHAPDKKRAQTQEGSTSSATSSLRTVARSLQLGPSSLQESTLSQLEETLFPTETTAQKTENSSKSGKYPSDEELEAILNNSDEMLVTESPPLTSGTSISRPCSGITKALKSTDPLLSPEKPLKSMTSKPTGTSARPEPAKVIELDK